MKHLPTCLLLASALCAGAVLTGCNESDSVYKPAVAKLMQDAQGLKQQGQLPTAICRMESAASLAPETPQVQYNLGVLYVEAQQWNSAIDHLQTATQLDPKFENAWYTLGYAYDQLASTLAATLKTPQTTQPGESGSLKLTPEACQQKSVEAYQAYLKLAPNGPQAKAARERLESAN